MGIEWQFSNKFSDISVTTGSTLFVCCAFLLLRTLILISPFHFTPQSDGKAALPHLTFFFFFLLCFMWSPLFIRSATSSNQVYCAPLDSYCCSIKELKTLQQGNKLIIVLLIIFYHVNCFLTNFTSTAAAISSFHVSFLWTTTSDANFKLVFSAGLI